MVFFKENGPRMHARPACLCLQAVHAQASPANGPTVTSMAHWMWNTSTGSWFSTTPGNTYDRRTNHSQHEPDLQEPELAPDVQEPELAPELPEPELAARKELTEEDIKTCQARRFSRVVERDNLERMIRQAERREQRQREFEELQASPGGTTRRTPVEYFQGVPGGQKAIRNAIQRQAAHNLDRIWHEQKRFEDLRKLLEENLKSERDSPRIDEQLVGEAKLKLQ